MSPITARSRKVSIVLPLYNMGDHVREALDSVLAQTMESWEVFVVDDGSADNGPALVRQYAEAHPRRIQLLEHEARRNRGVSASRNLALDHATGEFVAFLDADDVWLPDKLEVQLKVLDAHPDVGLVYSCAVPIRADGTSWVPSTDKPAPVRIVSDEHGHPRIGYGPPNRPVRLFEELVTRCCLVNSSVIVRRSVLDRAGRFEESMAYGEDWLLYTAVAYHALCYFIDRPLIRYRIHESHFSSSILGNELAYLRGAATFLDKLPSRLPEGGEASARRLIAENRQQVFGRALTESAKAWHSGQKQEAVGLAAFAARAFPSLCVSRRTGRFLKELLLGPKTSKG